MRNLPLDLRYAFRMIRKRPAFASIAVLLLALGIGANSAVFSLVNGLILHPLDFPNLDRLVEIRDVRAHQQKESVTVTAADYLDWKQRAASFQSMAAYTLHDFDLASEGNDPEGVHGLQATTGFLHTLGVTPIMGRDFRAGEDEPGYNQVALLSDRLWRNRFAADPAIIGRTIQLDSRPFLVIGVMPSNFDFPVPSMAVFTPLALSPAQRNDRATHLYLVAARLRDGVSLAQARAEMGTVASLLAREHPETNAERGARMVLLRERQGDFSAPFLVLLQATALFVLLIACANLANLQLAQAVARQREIAIRAALGAGRRRVVRLLLVESLVLACVGGAAGVAVAYLAVFLLKAAVPPESSHAIMGWNRFSVQPEVLWFTLAIAVTAGIVFGLSSAIQASRTNLASVMKQGGAQAGSKSRLRTLLVVGEVTLAMIAVVGSGQMVRGFRAMFDVYQGLTPDRVLTAYLALPVDRYNTPQRAATFFDAVTSAAAALPGVESAAVSSNLPGALHFNYHGEFEIEGRAALSHAEAPNADFQIAGPDYFATLHIPIRTGRPIGEQDGAESTPVAVISRRMAARWFPNENPVGKRIRAEYSGRNPWRTIVGVAGDVNQFWFEKDARPLLYIPYRQTLQRTMYLAISTRGEPTKILPALRQQIRRVDAALPLRDPRPMRVMMLETVSAMQLTTGLMTAFGILALALAAVGIYAVMAYSVSQRNREFGIRLALGARPQNVQRMVVRQGLATAIWGIAIGLAGGFAVSRAMSGIMFGLGGSSAAMLAGVPVLLLLISLAACWIPARAVTGVDPIATLKQE